MPNTGSRAHPHQTYAQEFKQQVIRETLEPGITEWKRQLQERAADVFGSPGMVSSEPPVDVTTLHAKIGQLTLENDFHMAFFCKRDLIQPDLPTNQSDEN